MSLQIQMIGTGSAFAKKYYNNNALILSGGFTLLVDCGITASFALHRLGIPFDQIDGIFITHLHADHVGGLEEFAFQMKFVYKKKPTLFLPEVLIGPIWEHSLKGGLEHDVSERMTLDDYFHVVPVSTDHPLDVKPDLRLECMRTIHIPGMPSFSLFFNEFLFYSADVIFDRKLIEHVHRERQCKYILHDCDLHNVGIVHPALNDLLKLPDEIQKKMHLMHYADTMENFTDIIGKMTFLQQHQLYNFT